MVYSERSHFPCILFVDDQADTRRFAKHVLASEGYEVLTARNSIEALVLAADFPRSIDLLITDPGMKTCQNGLELAFCFNILRPETAILFVSVSPVTVSARAWEQPPKQLAKPFSKKQLVEAVESSCAPSFG